MIKIAYNYQIAQGFGGISYYTKGLISHMCQNSGMNSFKFFLFCNSFRGNFPPLPEHIRKNCTFIPTRFPLFLSPTIGLGHFFQYKLLYSFLCQKYGIDIFHGTEALNIVDQKVISVSTVYDLFFLLDQEIDQDKHIIFMRKKRKELDKCDGIIAISESTRDDLIKINLPEEKIKVIYPGIDDNFLNFFSIKEDTRENDFLQISKKILFTAKIFLICWEFCIAKEHYYADRSFL